MYRHEVEVRGRTAFSNSVPDQATQDFQPLLLALTDELPHFTMHKDSDHSHQQQHFLLKICQPYPPTKNETHGFSLRRWALDRNCVDCVPVFQIVLFGFLGNRYKLDAGTSYFRAAVTVVLFTDQMWIRYAILRMSTDVKTTFISPTTRLVQIHTAMTIK